MRHVSFVWGLPMGAWLGVGLNYALGITPSPFVWGWAIGTLIFAIGLTVWRTYVDNV